MFADLATESESQLTTGRRAKKTKRDFRCLISRSSIGPCWSSHWVVWFARTVVPWRSQPVSIPATTNGILHFLVLRKKCCFPSINFRIPRSFSSFCWLSLDCAELANSRSMREQMNAAVAVFLVGDSVCQCVHQKLCVKSALQIMKIV